MVRGRWGKLAAVAAVFSAMSSLFAAGAVAEGESETGAFGSFRLKGTNGYSVLALAFSKPQFKHGEVALFVLGKSGAAIYLASAKVTPTTIDAKLGPVGEIAVEFQPNGPPEKVHASCKRGGVVTFEPGAWVGTMRFEGEEGFTEVSSHRTKAMPSPFIEAGCGGRSIGETVGPQVRGVRLVARSAAKKQAVYLQVNQNHLGAPVRAEASIEERRPGLIVSREVEKTFPAGAFDIDPALRTAALAPPPPFFGAAAFHRGAKPENRLTGNLSVDFPGRAGVSLSGAGFKATLVHAMRTEKSTHSARPNLSRWPSTKPSLTAFATPSLLAPR